MRLPWFVVVLTGCGRIGFEPPGADGANINGSNGSDSSNSVNCPAIAQCPDISYQAHLGTASTSEVISRDHGLSSTMCGSGNNNPELAVRFDVLEDATYTIDAPGQLVVYVQDTCCGGPELACGLAPYTLPFRAGDAFVVVIEGTIGAGVSVRVDGT